MKPKEFDDLIRSKFDQNDFEYKPANWDKLAAQMDKKPGRLRMLLWIPLAIMASTTSIAAALAIVVSLPAFLNHNNEAAHYTQNTQKHHVLKNAVPNRIPSVYTATVATKTAEDANKVNEIAQASTNMPVTHAAKKDATLTPSAPVAVQENSNNTNNTLSLNTNDIPEQKSIQSSARNNNVAAGGFNFYSAPEEEKHNARTMVSIASGVNYGAQISGYAIGATGKRMLNDKFYVEGDVAFVKNSTSEKIGYVSASLPTMARSVMTKAMERTTANKQTLATAPVAYNIETRESSYDLYYAQVTPTVGYNVRKNLSVGVGADVQRLLDNGRPAAAADNAESIQGIPNVDLGLIGKAEFAVSKKVKMGVLYRKGLANSFGSGTQYIDRSYTQIQLKYTIFNK